MTGLLFSILAGVLMSIQGTFNARLTERIGVNETNLLVQGSGFLLTIIILFFAGGFGGLKQVTDVNKLYLFGGLIGVGIIYAVIKGINALGVSCAILLILIAQLTMAGVIDYFGLFGTEKMVFSWHKIMGLVLMLAGILAFQWEAFQKM